MKIPPSTSLVSPITKEVVSGKDWPAWITPGVAHHRSDPLQAWELKASGVPISGM
jgi:hypothetical protein